VEWGTKGKPGGWQAEVIVKIKMATGALVSCRPLELLNYLPPALLLHPNQVFIVTMASESILDSNPKAETWVQDILNFRLRISEHVVCTSVDSTCPRASQTIIHQFLLPPLLLLYNQNHLSVSKNAYDKYWPDSPV
jgi:hypothetical protein